MHFNVWFFNYNWLAHNRNHTHLGVITCDEGGGICFRQHARARLSVCLSVCLCARLLKNACMIWMKCCVSTDVGTWTNWLTFEPGTTLKAGYRSRVHCREILFTPRCSPRARMFLGSGRLFCTTYGCAIFGFWPIFPIQNQPTAYGLHRRVITIFPRGSRKGATVSIDDL